MTQSILTPDEIEQFLTRGFVLVRECFSRPAAQMLTDQIWPRLGYDPQDLRFVADIKPIFSGGGLCTTCHQVNGNGVVIPPIWYTSYDRVNADGNVVANDATNDHWFYTEVRGRINFTDIAASPLLRKPSGHHHNGAIRLGFNSAATPGDGSRTDYDKILGWILNGAPE